MFQGWGNHTLKSILCYQISDLSSINLKLLIHRRNEFDVEWWSLDHGKFCYNLKFESNSEELSNSSVFKSHQKCLDSQWLHLNPVIFLIIPIRHLWKCSVITHLQSSRNTCKSGFFSCPFTCFIFLHNYFFDTHTYTRYSCFNLLKIKWYYIFKMKTYYLSLTLWK